MEDRVCVYEFPDGFRDESANMYGWLMYQGFSPKWMDLENRGTGLTLPVNEVPQLRILQKTNPARWGSAPAKDMDSVGDATRPAECKGNMENGKLPSDGMEP